MGAWERVQGWLHSAQLPRVAQEADRLRAPVFWNLASEGVRLRGMFNPAEIAHFAFFISGFSSQHRVLLTHPILGPQPPRSPTDALVPHSSGLLGTNNSLFFQFYYYFSQEVTVGPRKRF